MRGRYRILLGMAAGVGKTYRMLQEGRQAQAEGRDVVIGYLEPHDRPETAALAEGLEVVPRLRVAPRRARARGDGRRRRDPARAGARARRRARPHERAGVAQREALPGHRRDPRRRDRRHLDRQHPAPREPERRDRRADRRARPRDISRPRCSTRPTRWCSSTSRRRRCRTACGPGRFTRARRRVALHNFFRRTSSPRCASWRCARWPRTSRPRRSAAVLDPLSEQAVAERVLALVDAAATLAADAAARVALRAAPRRARSTRCGCGARRANSTSEEATQLAALRRLAVGARRALPRGGRRRPRRRPCGASSAERGSTYMFVGTPDERRWVRDHARLTAVADGPGAPRHRHPRRRPPRAARTSWRS